MRIAIITGAYGAIGQAIAEGIAKLKDYSVIMVGRDAERLENAASSIKKLTGNPNVSGAVIDLGRKQQISDFAVSFHGPIHLLINNAATTPRHKCLTPEGIEMQWAVNVLGYYWMMKFLSPKMSGQPDARIVNVASYWAGGLDLDDPEFKHRNYNNDSAYRQSKQADRMLSKYFAERLRPSGITVNACHPGDVNSKLSNDLGFGGHESPAQGAVTPLWCATSQESRNKSGKYFEHRQETRCAFADNPKDVIELARLCANY